MTPFFTTATATKAGDNSTTRRDSRTVSTRIRPLSVENERSENTIRWGWSRLETERLVRMQAVVRGWLLRKKACRIPARDVEAVLKDLHHKEKGLGKLVRYLLFIVLFYVVVILESDVTFQYSVGQGLRDLVESVSVGPDAATLNDVHTRGEFLDWLKALYFATYDGTELESPCNSCVIARSGERLLLYPPDYQALLGTYIPYPGTANDSLLFDFDNCPVCYGSDAEVLTNASVEGVMFCDVCSGMEYCFEDPCVEYDQARLHTAEVHGWNSSQVTVHSSDDCSQNYTSGDFLSGFGAASGATSAWITFLDPSLSITGTGEVRADGGGYVGNRNRVVGGLTLAWTYYEETNCSNAESSTFYSPCFADIVDPEDRFSYILSNVANDHGLIQSHDAIGFDIGTYGLTVDAGVYNTGLNMNACGLLSVLEAPQIVGNDMRSMTVVFNTYNGQNAGLFSTVEVSAKFSLGGEVQIESTVDVFPLPEATGPQSLRSIGRNVAIFVFVIALACYTICDVKSMLRELKDGRQFMSFATMRSPLSTATLLNLSSDILFIFNVVLWIQVAVESSRFAFDPVLNVYETASQVEEFTEALRSVGTTRWEQSTLTVIGGVFGLIRLFLLLRFHPRLSLVTDVLAVSMVHLVHFFIMFFVVVGVYSNLCYVIYGSSSDLFSSYTLSFVTMTRVALGEFDNIYPEMVVINFTATFVIIVTYQTLQFLLLFNIVISILLDAFQDVQERNTVEGADTLFETVMTTAGRWRIRSMNWMCRMMGMRRGMRATRVISPAVLNALHSSLSTRWKHSRPGKRIPPGATQVSFLRETADSRQESPAAARRSFFRGALRSPASHAPTDVQTKQPWLGKRGPNSSVFAGSASSSESRRSSHGLTRGKRVAVSYRHFDIPTAASVLRKSPLPEQAVWRKMRQIVGVRLGWTSFGGVVNTSYVPGYEGSSTRSRRWSDSSSSKSSRRWSLSSLRNVSST